MQNYVVYKWDTGDYIGHQKVCEFETAHEAIEFVNKQQEGFPYNILHGGALYKKISRERRSMEMKIRIRLTPLVHSLNQWTWLAETGLKKEDYFIAHPDLEVPEMGCYLCDCLVGSEDGFACKDCPFITVLGYNCVHVDGIYVGWTRAQNKEERRKAAWQMALFFRKCFVIYASERKQNLKEEVK